MSSNKEENIYSYFGFKYDKGSVTAKKIPEFDAQYDMVVRMNLYSVEYTHSIFGIHIFSKDEKHKANINGWSFIDNDIEDINENFVKFSEKEKLIITSYKNRYGGSAFTKRIIPPKSTIDTEIINVYSELLLMMKFGNPLLSYLNYMISMLEDMQNKYKKTHNTKYLDIENLNSYLSEIDTLFAQISSNDIIECKSEEILSINTRYRTGVVQDMKYYYNNYKNLT